MMIDNLRRFLHRKREQVLWVFVGLVPTLILAIIGLSANLLAKESPYVLSYLALVLATLLALVSLLLLVSKSDLKRHKKYLYELDPAFNIDER
jgi:uncharacterized protein YacL